MNKNIFFVTYLFFFVENALNATCTFIDKFAVGFITC